MRKTPTIQTMYAVDMTLPAMRNSISDQFRKNLNVDNSRVVDMLVSKGEMLHFLLHLSIKKLNAEILKPILKNGHKK